MCEPSELVISVILEHLDNNFDDPGAPLGFSIRAPPLKKII